MMPQGGNRKRVLFPGFLKPLETPALSEATATKRVPMQIGIGAHLVPHLIELRLGEDGMGVVSLALDTISRPIGGRI